ncbi:2OG-Fe(II) oxygenase [Niveibacterium sp. SC-1]|uniref:2OG-Fe(II) oxygenase n=1 Tax=Niveibacterium sp. SC-1 TaxID=3135646 RepID=UPI00311DEAB2
MDALVSPEWQQWLRENVARGCSPESMVKAMTEGGYGAEPARRLVAFALKRGVAQEAVPAAQPVYRYEPPRLVLDGHAVVLDGQTIRVSMRVEQPRVMVFDDLLSAQECEQLIADSRAQLRRSTIVDPASGEEAVITARTSEGTSFQRGANPLVARIEARLAALMQAPVEHGEGLQILHYNQSGEYRPHYDYFPPQDSGSARHLAKGGQRIATLIMYLNDVDAGGETIFPKIGLSVTPRRGSAVYFEYFNSHGEVDPATLHGGAPVTRGEKWIATKWLRERPYV